MILAKYKKLSNLVIFRYHGNHYLYIVNHVYILQDVY